MRRGAAAPERIILFGSAATGEMKPDILVLPVDYYEESKDVSGGIAYPANKYGKVIYAAA